MKPTCKDLNRDRLRRPDRVEVLALECGNGLFERGLEDVEVADHPSPVKRRALDDDLHPVVVSVELALGRWEPRYAV